MFALAAAAFPSVSGPLHAAANPARITVEGVDRPLSTWKLSDFDGRDLSSELAPQLSDNRLTVTATKPRQFVMKPRSTTTAVLAANEKVTLPGGVVVAGPVTGEGDVARAGWVRLTLEASPIPAPWDARAADYVTRLTFGLRPPAQFTEQVQLERPVVVKLGYEGVQAEEIPPLTIENTGLEHEKTVELRFRPSTSEPRLLVRSTISDVNIALRALGRLDVRPQQRSILGFGLESVPVVVEHVAPHGEPRPVAQATVISLELEGGARAAEQNLSLAAGATSTSFRVRSGGTGEALITATAAGVSGIARIEQRFPTAALVAALLGGAVGGYARRFIKGARRKRVPRQITEGVIVGLIAFVAGVLGVGYMSLPTAIVATEAGAFLTGAVTGFLGVAAIDAMTKKSADPARA